MIVYQFRINPIQMKGFVKNISIRFIWNFSDGSWCFQFFGFFFKFILRQYTQITIRYDFLWVFFWRFFHSSFVIVFALRISNLFIQYSTSFGFVIQNILFNKIKSVNANQNVHFTNSQSFVRIWIQVMEITWWPLCTPPQAVLM